ncbi:uncharacterized protein METZ01_LOCUS437816 [marine metagenome]|uniref:Uncharacterized protein n=1 Tax=marine metagenome TaxID=408172 RepID=A0A382YNW7_9ZZZZ
MHDNAYLRKQTKEFNELTSNFQQDNRVVSILY